MKFKGQNTVVVGLSHQHPHFLKKLQVSLSQENDDVEIMLATDHDFNLFK